MAVDGFGDRRVVGSRHDGLTATRLRELAQAGAALVRDAGADAILYLEVNGPAFPVAMFAAAWAGVPLVPINYRLGEEQLALLVGKHPSAFVITHDGFAEVFPGAAAAGRLMSAEGWLSAVEDADARLEEPVETDAPAVVIYTSGTTSEPKGVLLRHDNLVSYVLGSVEFASSEPDAASLVSVPPYHIAAIANVLSNLYSGRRIIVLEQFTAQEWIELVRREAITNALVVPTMLARILDAPGPQDVPSLRHLAYGGAPMPRTVIERALQQWQDVDFVNAYGLTETSSTVAVLGPEDHRRAIESSDPVVRARLSSVGRPVLGVEIEIRDDDGRPVPVGVPGAINVRGPQVSAEYAGRGRAVDADGYFDTRDQGHLDEEGYLFVGGRVDDTIIRGAENISPVEIEEVLLRHPGVCDAVVVGLPDPEWGQRIEAVAVLREGSTASGEEIRAFIRSALRSSKTPDHVALWDELPRTDTGKLVRRAVVARLVDEETGDPAPSQPSLRHHTAATTPS
jgi:acyl-CoA synthetase (AMP-forming)/AMP-acid ligase II